MTWLWPSRIPCGRVTLIEGPAGSGKSLVALDLVARLAADRPWADGAPQPHPGSKALVVCRQDHASDVVGARLERMGSDPQRFVQFHELELLQGRRGNEREPGPTRLLEFPTDLDALEKLISVDRNIKLVVIDPLSDFCGSKKLLAETIHRLNRLADEQQIAIVITLRAAARFNRQGELVVKSKHDTEAARCQWCCLADPEDPARRLFVPTLMNYAKLPKGQAFQPGEMNFDWLPGEVDLNDPLRNITPSAKWLKEVLKGGPMPAEELKKRGKELGFSEGQLQRAVYEVGGTKDRDNSYRKGSKSMWSLEERLVAAVEAEVRAMAEPGQPRDSALRAQQKEDRNQIPSPSMGESRRAGTPPQSGEGETIASRDSQVSSESCGESAAPAIVEPPPVAAKKEPAAQVPVEPKPSVAPVRPARPLGEQTYIPWDDSPSSRLNPLNAMLDAPQNPNQLRRNVKTMKSNEKMQGQTETKSKEH